MKFKLLKIFCLLFSFCALSSCGSNVENNSNISTIESSVIITNKKVSEVKDIRQIAYAFIYKLHQFSSFVYKEQGQANAKAGFIGYTQNIKDQTIKKGDEYYFAQNSNSKLVNSEHHAYFYQNKVVYDNDYKVTSLDVYLKEFGVSPLNLTLNGYVINDETILSCEKISQTDNIYKFRYILEADLSACMMKVQMKRFGGLSSYPIFSELSIELSLKDDWTPISICVDSKYAISIAIIGNMNCEQHLEGEFDKINDQSISIPDNDTYKKIIAKR